MDNIPDDIIREGTLMGAYDLLRQSSFETKQLLDVNLRIDSDGFIDITDDKEPYIEEEETEENLEALADLRRADDENAYQQDCE